MDMGCNLRDLANAEDINLAELKGKRVGIDAFLTRSSFLQRYEIDRLRAMAASS